MDCLPSFSFPSANTTFTSVSSPSHTPRKSSHRRKEAVTIPVIATVSLRTPINYTPPRSYTRMSARYLPNSLTAIPEGPAAMTRTTAPISFAPSPLSPSTQRPHYFRSTSADSVTTTSSSSMETESSVTPGSSRFSNSDYTTSPGLEPFPRLSMCDVDIGIGEEDEDDEEFWHCAGEHSMKATTPRIDVGLGMEGVAFYDKINAWRDSI